MENVSACPFCEKSKTKKTSIGNAHYVECLTCHARGPVAHNDDVYEGMDSAILLWNMPQRAGPSKMRDVTCEDCSAPATVLFDDTPLCSEHLKEHSAPLLKRSTATA